MTTGDVMVHWCKYVRTEAEVLQQVDEELVTGTSATYMP